jgi:hypothetical protein
VSDHPTDVPVRVLAPGPQAEVHVSHIVREAGVEAERDEVDPDHHLWRNGRLWWIAFTVHRGHLQERVRFSLGTDDVGLARLRRDEAFALYHAAADCNISIRLRSRQRRARNRRPRRSLAKPDDFPSAATGSSEATDRPSKVHRNSTASANA